ncbi:MAG: glycosyltransferase family 4 protein [Anaerolineales bacterium]|nr:glycosyltransferase family 4 protein [Anaerolineales bacterium]
MGTSSRAARIGIDVTAALTQGGGIGRYTRELVRAVTALQSPYQFQLMSAQPAGPPPVPDPLPNPDHVQYRPLPIGEKWLYRLWYRLRLPLPVQLATGRIDLFHSPDFVLPPVAGRIPTLLTVHDLSFIHYPQAYTETLVNYLNKVVPWSVGRASHILADSEATKVDLIDLWAVPADKITVLLSGVDEVFRPVTDERRLRQVRARYGLGEAPYLLAVGTVQPRKNYQMLIRAFRPVAANWPHNLVIAGGKGWLYDDILAEVEAQGLADRVIFTGFVDDGDLPALYTSATLSLMPSLYEGFGIPLLEAMACGVPIMAANVSSLPEVAGEAGLLLPPADETAWSGAIHRLLLSRERRLEMVAAGFHQARTFTWRRAARQLLTIYDNLL